MKLRAFDVAVAQPWAIEQAALETILDIANRAHEDSRLEPEALMAKYGQPLEDTERVVMRDGVAILSISGPIFRHANLMTRISGATSTDILATDFRAALDNPYVRGIVLDINSPGGQVDGINELAEMIRGARGVKPIHAYVGGSGLSAAYWLATAADEITIDRTALLGSIGVIMSLVRSKGDDKELVFVSSQSPDKRLDPSTLQGASKIQATVDQLAGVFVEAVAAYRGVAADVVLKEFGQGGAVVGKAAVAAGMADKIGSLEAVITALAGSASTRKGVPTMARRNPAAVTVASTEDLRAALEAGHEPEQIKLPEQPDLDKVRAEARAEGAKEAAGELEAQLAAAREEGRAEGVTAERARILAIQAIAPTGFDDLVAEQIEAGATEEVAAMAFLKATKERGVSLAQLQTEAPRGIGPAGPGSGQKSGWAKITARFSK